MSTCLYVVIIPLRCIKQHTHTCSRSGFTLTEYSLQLLHNISLMNQYNSGMIKGLKITLFINMNHNMRIFGVIPLPRYKKTFKQPLNDEKRWKMRWRANPLIFFGVRNVPCLEECTARERIFQWSNIVVHPCQSVQCVRACVRACVRVCVCVCVHLLHNYAWTLVDIYIFIFLDNISISMYIMCVCLFSALSRGVGALQISIIIIIMLNKAHCITKPFWQEWGDMLHADINYEKYSSVFKFKILYCPLQS